MDSVDQTTPADAEARLLAELAREERARAALGIVLPHLVGAEDAPVLAEELVVRTRAFLAALAADLLQGAGADARASQGISLVAKLAERPGLLAHCHALAVEAQTAERLARAGLDPVLSPVFETWLGASRDTAVLAMSALTAQARFISRARRMDTGAAELPAAVMHEALLALADVAGADGATAAAALRETYAEGRTRLALFAQLELIATGAGGDGGTVDVLDPRAAGFALFATALARRVGCSREEAVLAGAPGQELRLGLLLRAAGVPRAGVQAALAQIHPDAELPEPWLDLAQDRAAALLAGAGQ